MRRNESQPQFEREESLSEVRAFLDTEIKNAHFVGKGMDPAYEAAIAQPLESALADFNRGDYKATVAVLERYHNIFRRRADEETDIESIPAIDNMTANKISVWIEVLRGIIASQ